ncbi:glycosyltransferase family 4 protein [Nakamurella deserti]|uniref:glycosyltransferase family 4 protein n=1 Tax=Nakamurella deserti TaxID=2164074 RepID=UPI001F0BED54|nr:MraY family glycosyltransferase [Nakamurella deserti]
MISSIPAREYGLVFATAVAVTYLVTGVVRLFATRIGAFSPIRERDVHSVPTPRMGGVAVYLGVTAAVLMGYNLPALSEAFRNNTEILGVLVAGGVICFVGAVDDRFDLSAVTKLAGQVLAAGLLVLFGVQWVLLRLPTGSDGDVGNIYVLGRDQAVILTVLLAVLLTNAMNFIDGLDGLLAGVAFISAIAAFAFSLYVLYDSGNNGLAQPPLIAAALAGACLGFLPHNFFPARIFMGDSGSMFIGVTMAAAITSTAGKIDPLALGTRSSIALLAPLIVALAVVFIPLLDFFLAVVRRTRAGKSPMSADKKHLHHRMLQIGHTHRQAVLIFYLWALVFAGGAVSLGFFNWQVVIGPWLGGAVAALVVSAHPWLRASRLNRLRTRSQTPAD